MTKTEDVVALCQRLRLRFRHSAYLATDARLSTDPDCQEAADLIQYLSDRIVVLEARQHGGEHGAAGDAIDFACDHCAPDEALAFLEDWRSGQTSEWPGYVKWLAVQRAGAAESRALTKEAGIRGQ